MILIEFHSAEELKVQEKSMIILGINEDKNATAALVKDGKVLACASQERFTRVKNDTEYPYHAIEAVLKIAGIRAADIDRVAFTGTYFDALTIRIKRTTRFTIADYVREMHEHWKKVLLEKKPSDFYQLLSKDPRFVPQEDNYYDYTFMDTLPLSEWDAYGDKVRADAIYRYLGLPSERVQSVDHHKAHAYYAYFASPRNDNQKAVIVTADSWGDDCNATISVVEEGGQLKEIHRTAMCNLARMYRWTTLILGMRPNEHEYKVMGLAAYANQYIFEPAYRVYKETLIVDGLDFKWDKKPVDMYFYFKEKFEGMRFDGIAAALQLWLEELLAEWIGNIMSATGAGTLYYSGGLSLNVKANRVISELPGVEALFIPPSGGDESTAIGSAFVLAHEQGDKPFALPHVYLGYESSEKEIAEVISSLRDDPKYTIIKAPHPEMIAGLLCAGKVLGRCVGKMEFGARALGNRSILADPSKYKNVRIINDKIKCRDFWMPFAPSILSERAGDYLVNPKQLQASYMAIAFDSTPLARQHLRAALHPYDFTIRPQVVTKKINADYYALIKAFEKETGIGAVLNTSFNLHGEPIVCTASDAVDALQRSGLDGVIFSDFLILKCNGQT